MLGMALALAEYQHWPVFVCSERDIKHEHTSSKVSRRDTCCSFLAHSHKEGLAGK